MTYQDKVNRIVQNVKTFYKKQRPFHIFHGSTNSTRIQSFRRADTIDVSDLDEVLKIDTEKQVMTVEPNVPMDKLVRAARGKGLVPKIVMEFPGITAGGGSRGCSRREQFVSIWRFRPNLQQG
ncbi:MAG: FAD-dependent oxidoreductase [Candidatus Nomurabacteria bacterium]|jgi:FAD/FMN-containing dehydrogenase|nr:FAD-dependent oxidoreductase [Candidatus Nomurabacteria bacterium]